MPQLLKTVQNKFISVLLSLMVHTLLSIVLIIVICIKKLTCNRHCSLTAGSSVFNNNGNYQIRIIHVGITDKPGMTGSVFIKFRRARLTCRCITPSIQAEAVPSSTTFFISFPIRLASFTLISLLYFSGFCSLYCFTVHCFSQNQ